MSEKIIPLNPLRTAPITTECMIACASLFIVCSMQSMEGESFDQAQRTWGAVVSRPVQLYRVESGVPLSLWQAPLDLWNGQWWRIPLGAFHHVNIFHLALNCILFWIVGERLEQRWGSLRYGLFLLPSIFIPLVAQAAVGDCALGLSGVSCSIFGALLALQQIETKADDFSEESIQLTLGGILLGIPLTITGIISLPNVAHVTGVLHGWFTALVLCGPFPRTAFIRLCYVTAHLILVPVFWLATHPIGNGRYLWYLAVHSPDREKWLRLAIDADPTLGEVWLQLADCRSADHDPTGAWSAAVNGLAINPTDATLIEEARRLWLRMKRGAERDTAESLVRQIFGKQAEAWLDAIRHKQVAAAPTEPKSDLRQFSVEQPVKLDWPARLPPNEPAKPVDPELPNSAAEGVAL